MSDEDRLLNLPQREEKILKFWEEHRIFEKSLAKNKGKKTFVFYEGPPTANGAPGIHHVEARAFKDIMLRYKSMRGFFVPRKAGWDTHGLPVEIQIEKKLGLKSKKDIEKFGIAKFNEECRKSVWEYKKEWEELTRRIAFWLDLEHPYVTYEPEYMESLWWIIKEIWKKKLLYRDFKIVPWCARCGTGLSSHEMGLGYKTIREDSIYVKLKLKHAKNEYVLVWTTTPWTLPANVALAVNAKAEYTKWKVGSEFIWAINLPKGHTGSEGERMKGLELVGREYEPLFRVPAEYSLGEKPPYKIFAADFVSTQEGTGVVHIAPAFGDDDMMLVKKEYRGIKYPILLTVGSDGRMGKGIVGEGKFAKDADRDVMEDLKARGLLFAVEPYEHEYPHCWRCETPLLYYARSAWWIGMSRLREKLLASNKKINWVPAHIKDGRFGEFLREVRDWAFSRERYWGTPLPIWQCADCGHEEVIGSRDELGRRAATSGNTYYTIRHGYGEHQMVNTPDDDPHLYHLTPKGKGEIMRAVSELKKKNFDLILTSPVLRTVETAAILGRELGVSVKKESRLHELNVGVFEHVADRRYHEYFSSDLEKFEKAPPEGETLRDVRVRLASLMHELERTYRNKRILLVSHEYPIWILHGTAQGFSEVEMVAAKHEKKGDFVKNAEVIAIPYRNLPRDEAGAVNLHRPYVDAVTFSCTKCDGTMRRVSDVVDVWFDSGAMPFAQAHYPFAFAQNQNAKGKNQNVFKKLPFPADYISEAVDQTRGWFYTLLAVSTLLGKEAPYKNVISLGHVLDKNGQKMSKSKGNAVDPRDMINKYGSDVIRWYFFTVNAPGDPKLFDEKDLLQKSRSFHGILWNSLMLFETYAKKAQSSKLSAKGGSASGGKAQKLKNPLDQWVTARRDDVVREVTARLEAYDVISAARAIEEFVVGDFSQWYLRRSRRRFQQPETEAEFRDVAGVTAEVLRIVAILAAPFIPFLAEAVFQKLKKKAGYEEVSVHLCAWPKGGFAKKSTVIADMAEVRRVASEGLKLRAAACIKVRQPLASLAVTSERIAGNPELAAIVRDEVNVKKVVSGKTFSLDTVITPELKEEGMVREFIRNIQELRKDSSFKPQDLARLMVEGDALLTALIRRSAKLIQKETRSTEILFKRSGVPAASREVDFDGHRCWVGIEQA